MVQFPLHSDWIFNTLTKRVFYRALWENAMSREEYLSGLPSFTQKSTAYEQQHRLE